MLSEILEDFLKNLLIYDKNAFQNLNPEDSAEWKCIFEITNKASVQKMTQFPLPSFEIFQRSLRTEKIESLLKEKSCLNEQRLTEWASLYIQHRYPRPDALQQRKKETLEKICSRLAFIPYSHGLIRETIKGIQIEEKLNYPNDYSFASGAFSNCMRELCVRHLAYEYYCEHFQNRYVILYRKIKDFEKTIMTPYFFKGTVWDFYQHWYAFYEETSQLLREIELLTVFDPPPPPHRFDYQNANPPAWIIPAHPDGALALSEAESLLPKTALESFVTTAAAPLAFARDTLVNTAAATGSAIGWMSQWFYNPKI